MKKLATIALLSALVLVGITFSSREAQAAAWFNCQAVSVFEFSNAGTPLLMAECSNNYQTGVNWTAVQLSSVSEAQANRFTSMATAAVLSSRKFRVFMSDVVCPGNTNCRIATSWSLFQP